ncbi:porin family protein [Fulvivirga lutea]|uniref:PorT family protein n=1 Tax=Fulvivirga lutea TaxID=2810512 RepID=A0A974WIF7_9BACT|nr:porin family protein [Fulvivirga lutea]QSE96725.1 PorT family protein [Fulvivirga lutea]
MAQKVDCTNTLEQARTNFERGHLYSIPAILKPCLDNGFNKVQKIESYLILTRTYLLIDDPISAEDSYLKLLRLDPEYTVDPENDPVDIVYLNEKFTTTPIFILYARGGLNFTNASSIVNFGVDNTEQSQEEYSMGAGFNLGGGAELNLSNHLSLGLELNYSNRRYNYKNTLFNGDAQDMLEIQSMLNVPIFLKYRMKFNDWHPYVYAGYSFNYLIGARAELELKDLVISGEGDRSEISVTGPEENLIDLRNRVNHNILGGIGVRYRIGYNYLFLDARYSWGMNNIVDENNQYSNQSLLYKYGMVDDYKRLTNIEVTAGYIWPLYKPRKIDEKKGLFRRLFDK